MNSLMWNQIDDVLTTATAISANGFSLESIKRGWCCAYAIRWKDLHRLQKAPLPPVKRISPSKHLFLIYLLITLAAVKACLSVTMTALPMSVLKT